MPDLPQSSADNLEDAEIRYALTLSKESQQQVRGRACAHVTFQPAMNLSCLSTLTFKKNYAEHAKTQIWII